MYNIITTCNHQYRQFGHILVNSILANCRLERFNKIIVGDVGLTDLDRHELSAISDRVHVVQTSLNHEGSVTVHSKEWIELVSFKTSLLEQYLINEDLPAIMLDVDQIVIEDFIPPAVPDVPITVCARKTPSMRDDGLRLDYIASFFVANNREALEFVAAWRKRIVERIDANLLPGYETPALCELLIDKTLGEHFSVVVDEEYSSPNAYVPGKTKILHCKSEGSHNGDNFLQRRLSQVVGIDASFYRKYVSTCSV